MSNWKGNSKCIKSRCDFDLHAQIIKCVCILISSIHRKIQEICLHIHSSWTSIAIQYISSSQKYIYNRKQQLDIWWSDAGLFVIDIYQNATSMHCILYHDKRNLTYCIWFILWITCWERNPKPTNYCYPLHLRTQACQRLLASRRHHSLWEQLETCQPGAKKGNPVTEYRIKLAFSTGLPDSRRYHYLNMPRKS